MLNKIVQIIINAIRRHLPYVGVKPQCHISLSGLIFFFNLWKKLAKVSLEKISK